ncbi:MAG: hypothetical protein QOH53_930 [Ilumatobacteraceae bacterium]
MIDQDLSNELHSLAATLSEPFDLAALHRRIAMQSRRRVAVKVGFAGAGVAAVVGGLFVVQERPGPAPSGLAAASSLASSPPAALPECDAVLAALRPAKSPPDTGDRKDATTDPSASAGDVQGRGFKGIVTILTVDGPRLTFHVDQPNGATPTEGDGTIDAGTEWVDGPTHLDSPPTLQVGAQLGLATKPDGDGVNHVVLIDVGATVSVDDQPTMTPDEKLATAAQADPSTEADATVELPGPSLPPGPTEKSMGTIATVDAISITVTLTDQSGQERTVAIDPATTPFYAGDSVCVPSSLTVGQEIGVAFHFDDAGNVIGDAAMLMP